MAMPLVLVVDDAPDLGTIVSALGRRGGYEVVCRFDAASAWDFLLTQRPDLVLLDVQLPGENGVSVCRRARAEKQLAGLAVALFTHWGLPGDVAMGLEAGAEYLVSKDLLAHPAAWQARMADILPTVRGRCPRRLVGWRSDSAAKSPSDWINRLQSVLRSPALRGMAPEVRVIVVRRALQTAFPPHGGSAVSADGCEAIPGLLPKTPPPELLVRLSASLADQVWRLLGTQQSQPFWEALAQLVPGAPELLNSSI